MKTKVVHIITRMILGGAQENTLFTCEGLHNSAEWDVTLITGPALGPEGELLQRARNNGIKTILVPSLRRNIHPYRDCKAFSQLLKTIRKLQPDIVHTHSSKAGILGRVAAKIARVPIIIHTIHGLPFHPYQNPLSNTFFIAAEAAAARCCNKLVCVADAMRDQALDAGIGHPAQYITIHSGMETKPYLEASQYRNQIRERYSFRPNDIVIGKIARLFPLKGHEYVLQAAPKIIEKIPNARFFFVGDGILRDNLEEEVSRLGINDRVVFAGLVDASKIPTMVSAMDILVHASLREGLPRVLVQALLGEKPVVSFSVDGAPEVVINGETGYLVRPRAVNELAHAVIKLASNPSLAKKMGRNGRNLFLDQFRTETMVSKISKLYQHLLQHRV